MQQAPLRVDQGLQLPGHAVEIAPEIGDLVAPPPHARTDARVELARRRRVEGGAQVADRCRQIPGEPGAEGEARQDADADRRGSSGI